MRTRTLIALILALLLSSSLCACSQSDSTDSAATDSTYSETTSTSETDPIRESRDVILVDFTDAEFIPSVNAGEDFTEKFEVSGSEYTYQVKRSVYSDNNNYTIFQYGPRKNFANFPLTGRNFLCGYIFDTGVEEYVGFAYTVGTDSTDAITLIGLFHGEEEMLYCSEDGVSRNGNYIVEQLSKNPGQVLENIDGRTFTISGEKYTLTDEWSLVKQ